MNKKVVLFLLFSFILSIALVGQVYDNHVIAAADIPIGDILPPQEPPVCIPGSDVVCIENPLNTGSLVEIIDSIINIVFRIALAITPLMIIYGGFLFVTGGGNPDQISRGRRVLMWTVIGLVVIIISKGLVSILQKALTVNGS